ncbi:MAG TPA: FtsQ-type POTRA domain-containing protein [Thermoanaerobaculia bacterium]|nr:FtsQ-type POTRA domain-containing protein [Thermoanaerobaculia bacterium]
MTAAGRVLDFRRRPTPPRRRRRSPLLALGKPLLISLLTVAGPFGLGYWVLTARYFQLRDVKIAGTRRVSAAWVRWRLGPLLGRNLLRLSLAEVAERLAANPWIASADLAKELPGGLRVAVTERRPVVLLRSGEDLSYADARGRPIAPVPSPGEAAAARRSGLLVVAFSHRPEEDPGGIAGALAAAAELRGVRPDWAAGLVRIDVLGEEDYRLVSDALPCPLLVSGGHVAERLRRFERLMPQLARRYPGVASVDLRLSHRIVVQPVLSPQPKQGKGA